MLKDLLIIQNTIDIDSVTHYIKIFDLSKFFPMEEKIKLAHQQELQFLKFVSLSRVLLFTVLRYLRLKNQFCVFLTQNFFLRIYLLPSTHKYLSNCTHKAHHSYKNKLKIQYKLCFLNYLQHRETLCVCHFIDQKGRKIIKNI